MALRVAINGFGRIGRMVLRSEVTDSAIETVAINDLTDARTLAHLLKYDSAHSAFPGQVEVNENKLIINGKLIKDPAPTNHAKLPGKQEWIDILVPTQSHRSRKSRAPSQSRSKKGHYFYPRHRRGHNYCHGGGLHRLRQQQEQHKLERLLHDQLLRIGRQGMNKIVDIQNGLVTTVHSYTNDHIVLYLPYKGLSGATASMIPTSTANAIAVRKEGADRHRRKRIGHQPRTKLFGRPRHISGGGQ